jgi:cytidine deaminase
MKWFHRHYKHEVPSDEPLITSIHNDKFNTIIYRLTLLSQKSILECKHAAAVIKYGVIVSIGYNEIIASASVHAECMAINKYISSCRKNKKRHNLFKNCTLVVIRIGDQNKRIMMSKPCANCIQYIKLLNIKKIYYSDNSGNLIREGSNITSNHYSRLSVSMAKK